MIATEDKEITMEADNVKEKNTEMTKKGDEEKEVEKVEKINEWSEVTPGKASRSPSRNLEFEKLPLLTNSRFSVLMPTMEQEEEENEQHDKEDHLAEQSEEEACKETEEAIPRKILPRKSKQNHRYLKVKTSQKALDADPSYLNKKKPRRQ